jgi:hypothetical protein
MRADPDLLWCVPIHFHNAPDAVVVTGWLRGRVPSGAGCGEVGSEKEVG